MMIYREQKKIIKFVFALLFSVGIFFTGMQYQAFMYIDACLDIGGGMNPGEYPICVVEE